MRTRPSIVLSLVLLAAGCGGGSGARGPLADLEDLGLALDAHYAGEDGAGGFTSGPLRFLNAYDPQYGAWSGFAASTMRDTTTPGWDNQYSAIPGEGSEGTPAYAVGYTGMGPARLELATGAGAEAHFAGLWVTHTTYAYLSMRDGDAFAKKFGGTSGDEPDWFRLTIRGQDAAGGPTGSLEVYLADFRGPAAEDHLVADWRWVDLSGLGASHAMEFALDSSDLGEYGMNTPAYFALDGIELRE
jgi:hypothetical protein